MGNFSNTDVAKLSLTSDEQANAVEAARRDPTAFAPLYRAYVTPVFRYLYSRLGNEAEAEDLTSQVFMEALESLNRYRHRGEFRAWLFSIARHRLLNQWRRRPMESGVDRVDEVLSSRDDPLTETVRKEEIESLKGLVEGLEEVEQDLLRLRFVAELSFGEIAVVLRISEGAAKKRLYRLLARMESQLEANHG